MGNKVVYNACFGGFGLSKDAIIRYGNLKGIEAKFHKTSHGTEICTNIDIYEIPRHDLNLVQVVEELGKKANGEYSCLEIEEIEGDTYSIDEYDGHEAVLEPKEVNWIRIEEPGPQEKFLSSDAKTFIYGGVLKK